MSLFDLTNKTILITGGYGYLGKSLCLGLAKAGAHVYVLARSQEKFDREFIDHQSIFFQQCNVTKSADIYHVLEKLASITTFDVIINNAFHVKGQAPLGITEQEWSYSMDSTLNSYYYCIKAITPYFIQQGFGKIINISSMYGMVAPDFDLYTENPEFLNPPHYGAAKAGVMQLTRYFAQYLGQHGIQVNAISPGPFPNKAVQKNTAFIDRLKNKTALKRIGEPNDLIGGAIFLSSNAANYVTGHNLVIDGGWTIS